MIHNSQIQDLAVWVREFISNYPEHKKEANDMFQLCLDQIEDGESEQNEIEACKYAIEDLRYDEDDDCIE